jgi:hypothetical protein
MNTVVTETAGRESGSNVRTPYRLVFPHGVANLTIRVDRSMPAEYRGEFYGPRPRVTQLDGVVTVDYPRFNPFSWGRTSADIALSPLVAWRLEIRDGVSQLVADLQEISLAAIDVRGGVRQAELRLPRPTGSVPIRVSGGVSGLTLRRPSGVAARVQISGGASKLELDTQYLGAIGGPVRLETPDYANAVERYDLEIGGGASKVTVARD